MLHSWTVVNVKGINDEDYWVPFDYGLSAYAESLDVEEKYKDRLDTEEEVFVLCLKPVEKYGSPLYKDYEDIIFDLAFKNNSQKYIKELPKF